MAIVPVRDFLLLKDTDNEGVSEGGLFIAPSTSTDNKAKRGVVVAVGPELAGKPGDDLYVPVRGATTSVTELPSGTRVHYVDVGGVHSGEVESYMNKVKDVISRKTEPQYVVGDVVIYSVYGANEVRDGTGKFYLVPAREVWAKVV